MKRAHLLILLLVAGCSDSSTTSGPYSPPEPIVAESPEQRVNAFIEDWYTAWSHTVHITNPFDSKAVMEALKQWQPAVEQVRKRHYSADSPNLSFVGSMSTMESDHDPDHEEIIRSESAGDTAIIETQTDRNPAMYYEYQLKNIDGDWRISRLLQFLDPAGELIFQEQAQKNILGRVADDAPLPELPADWKTEGNDLFIEGRKVKIGEKPHPIELRQAGEIQFVSGVIGVSDFGFIMDDFRPLGRSVRKGKYPVEYATAGGLVLGVRIKLGEGSVSEWKPAVRLDTTDAIVGVDAGNVAIFDAQALMSLTKRELERRYIDWTDVAAQGEATPIRLGDQKSGAINCIVADSGYGDGAYPCYWGLNKEGEIVFLLVDFLVIEPSQKN